MTAVRKSLAGADGLHLWANWQAKRSGAPLRGIVELKLFTDAWIIAEASHGPYFFINAVPYTVRGERFGLTPSIALRVEHYLAPDLSDMSVTSDDHYHGGWLYDEAAALLALVLGARIVAGPVDREFGYNPDPLGQPRAHALALLPALPTRAEAPQISWLFEDRDLRDIALFETFADLDSAVAVSLIKSARLFQQALWVCDATPETAWLLLVSAVETAAAHWNASMMSPVERLTRSYPMCMPPDRKDGMQGIAEERPSGLGAGARRPTWVADDLPMYLHTFAYVARHAILAWWRTLIDRTSNDETMER